MSGSNVLFLFYLTIAAGAVMAAALLVVKLVEITRQTWLVWFSPGSAEAKLLRIVRLIANFPGGSAWTQWLAALFRGPGGSALAGYVYRYPTLMLALAGAAFILPYRPFKLGIAALLIAAMLLEFLFLLSHRIKLGAYDNIIVLVETQLRRKEDEARLKALIEDDDRRLPRDEAETRAAVVRLYDAFDFTRGKLVERVMLLYMSSFLVLVVGFGAVYDIMSRCIIPGNYLETALPKDPHWFQALYFSVISQLTVGYGDIAPVGPLTRLVVVGQICAGFGLFVLLLSAMSSTLDLERITGEKRE